jgi:hypothetical protein
VGLDRALLDNEVGGNFGVGQTLCHEAEDVALPGGEGGEVR